MRKYENFILFSDLDGTLFGKDMVIPENNITAIKHFINNGGRFALATGRSTESIKAVTPYELFNFYSIVYNGCGIYDFIKDEYIEYTGLCKEAKDILYKILDKFENLGVVIFADGYMYSVRENEMLDRIVKIEKIPAKVVKLKELPEKWLKVILVDDNENLLKVEEFIHTLDTTGISHGFSQDVLYELLPKGINKGKALDVIRSKYMKSNDVIVACGDYFNDYDLLKNADISIAEKNSPDIIKQQADYIGCECSKGLIEYAVNVIDNIIDTVK